MPKVKQALKQDGSPGCHIIFCPGCRREHAIDDRWIFNGNFEKPTFTPSLLLPEVMNGPYVMQPQCHSFIIDGRIQFLSDCYHDKMGTTCDLPDIE